MAVSLSSNFKGADDDCIAFADSCMKGHDLGEGCLSVVFGGFLLFIALAVILGIAGFERHEIYRVWLALAIVWVPWLFVQGARRSD